MLDVEVKILDPRIGTEFPAPAFQSDGAAGIDLIACLDEPLELKPGMCELIPSGLAIHIGNPGWAAIALPRSGLGHKQGLVLGNGIGLIDSDYQGQIMISAFNRNPPFVPSVVIDIDPTKNHSLIKINPGDRIAQLVFIPVAQPVLGFVSEFTGNTERGEMGFGSTGIAAE